MAINNIPNNVFNQMQARKLIFVYVIISLIVLYVSSLIGASLIKEFGLPIYIVMVVIALVITVVMGVKFNFAKSFPIKYEHLDKLLSQYKPNNPEAYDNLKKATAENPDNFPVYLEEWIAVEKETYDEYKAKPKHYQFTDSKK